MGVNTGLLVCEQDTHISYFDNYVSCLANIQECRAKDNFEYLKVMLENDDWACETIYQTMEPTSSPLPENVDNSMMYDSCTLETVQCFGIIQVFIRPFCFMTIL